MPNTSYMCLTPLACANTPCMCLTPLASLYFLNECHLFYLWFSLCLVKVFYHLTLGPAHRHRDGRRQLPEPCHRHRSDRGGLCSRAGPLHAGGAPVHSCRGSAHQGARNLQVARWEQKFILCSQKHYCPKCNYRYLIFLYLSKNRCTLVLTIIFYNPFLILIILSSVKLT